MPPLPTITAEEEGGDRDIIRWPRSIPFHPVCDVYIGLAMLQNTERKYVLFGTLTRSMEARSCVSAAVLIYS
jgi:hypothetical protein